MAEVYWGREWELQQQGFDYTYDKRLYDRLVEGDAQKVREHLKANLDFQRHSARFLENHDEPRAAATFSPEKHRAAAVTTFLCPGLRFFYDGQLEGATVRLPTHLCRQPIEPVNEGLRAFYRSLLACLDLPAVRDGGWRLLDAQPAWNGNWTHDCFVIQSWRREGQETALAAVNFSGHQSQCYVSLPFPGISGRRWLLQDLLSDTSYEREGDGLAGRGLYLDMPAWGYHVFRLIER
jgi:glycosidase